MTVKVRAILLSDAHFIYDYMILRFMEHVQYARVPCIYISMNIFKIPSLSGSKDRGKGVQ